jgi:gamma-glutamylcyclotransferase (GGCT)/AIG2-like uncharacterized protein YtfP
MAPAWGVAVRRVDAHVMKDFGIRRYLRFALLGTLIAICAGCLALSQGNKGAWDDPADPKLGSETHLSSSQPAAVKASAPAQDGISEGKATTAIAPDKPAPVGLSEEEKAKTLALDLAKANTDVKKIKVCHDKKNDEWWLTLYEDAKDHFRLRQYTWSIQQDQPEEFLVLKRISKCKLESDLTASDPDRTCQEVKFEPGDHHQAVAASQSLGATSKSKESLSPSTKPSPALDTGKTTIRKQDAVREVAKARVSTLATSKPKGIAEPQTNTITATVQAPSKPSPSAGSVRKAVSPPDKRVFVQASAKSSPADEVLSKKNQVLEQPVSRPKATEKARPSPKARFASDTGVFSLAAVRRESKPSISHSESKIQSDSVAKRDSVAAKEKKPAMSDVDAALADLDRQSGLLSPRDTVEQRRDVPTSFVFVYGSEMNHQELLSWLRANNYDSSIIIDAAPAVLDSYDLVWNYYSPSRGGGAVNLEPKTNSSVWGLLIEVEDRGLKAFDKKEGHPSYYARGDNRVSVQRVSDGRTVFAWLYRAKPNRSGARNVWPTAEYKQRIIEAANFWQFPRPYVQKLENLPTH